MKRYIRNEPRVVRVEPCCDEMKAMLDTQNVEAQSHEVVGSVILNVLLGPSRRRMNYCFGCGAKIEDVVEVGYLSTRHFHAERIEAARGK